MDLPEELRAELEKELIYVGDRIIAERDPRRKVFFYSAAYGITRRIMNLCFDPQLGFMELVLQLSYNTINDRVNRIMIGKDPTVPLIDGFFEKLAQEINNLAQCIKADKDTYKILETIVTLTYTTTGNGHYLYTKGLLKI